MIVTACKVSGDLVSLDNCLSYNAVKDIVAYFDDAYDSLTLPLFIFVILLSSKAVLVFSF
jgi:hypothetical protein